VKKPSLRLVWIALPILVVTVCVSFFAVTGAERRQIEAVATQLSDPIRDKDGPPGAAPIATTLARAERHSITETLAVTGSLVAREEVVVGAEVDGLRIVEILADVGDRVEKGQVLARFDSTMLRAQLAENTSAIAMAEASIGQVKASIAEANANEAQAADALKRAQTGQGRRGASYRR
jgi:HlyD family secretion protein